MIELGRALGVDRSLRFAIEAQPMDWRGRGGEGAETGAVPGGRVPTSRTG